MLKNKYTQIQVHTQTLTHTYRYLYIIYKMKDIHPNTLYVFQWSYQNMEYVN